MQSVSTPTHPNTHTPTQVSVFDLRHSLESISTEVRDILAEIKQTADAKTRLAACAELRKTVALARDTLQAMLKTEAITAVEQAVLEALQEAAPRTRNRVMAALSSRAA